VLGHFSAMLLQRQDQPMGDRAPLFSVGTLQRPISYDLGPIFSGSLE
jgi:hypothetical protein